MAVEDKYVNSNISGNVVDKLLKAINSADGCALKVCFETFEVAAADDNGSIYRVFKNLDPNIIPLFILSACDAITGSTAWDIGLYRPDLGTVIDADVFASNLDFSSAVGFSLATVLDGMEDIAIENRGKRLFEHAGHTVANKLTGYDLALTADTVGTAAGTVSVMMVYAQG